MYIRTIEGNIVLFDVTKYVNEYNMYFKLWELKYNKKLKEEEANVLDLVVKYIEGLKSSEQKKVINQIQRTERGFMKVLGKAHGE